MHLKLFVTDKMLEANLVHFSTLVNNKTLAGKHSLTLTYSVTALIRYQRQACVEIAGAANVNVPMALITQVDLS